MKVFELRDGFGFEHLQRGERDEPEPKADEVRVELHAVSLNYRDLLVVQGKYDPRMNLPRIPVSDGAGVITAKGENVKNWQAGDRVVIPFMPAWLQGGLTAEGAASALGGAAEGLLRESVCVRADALLPLPEHLGYEQAATLPCAGVAAWNGLFVAGSLEAGQTLLLQGTGGVSLFGLQFGKVGGATTIVISSSDAKLERARLLGANHLVNYRAIPAWEKQVLAITEGRGVDLTLEVGGTGTLSKTLRATGYGGRVSLIGVLSGITGEVQLGHALHKAIQISGIYAGSRAMFAQMNAAITQYHLEPVVDRVFGFDESIEALRYLESGAHFGKVVVRIK